MSKKKPKDCGVCDPPSYERNNYFYGKLMTVRDFCQEQEYFNEKRRLLNRMVLGWGVVCGLDVCLKEDKLVVHPGLALDCCGREILVCEDQEVHVKELEEHCHAKPREGRVRLVVCLEYDECKSEPVRFPAIGCGDEEEKSEYNRIRDHFRITVTPWDRECHHRHDHGVCPLDEIKEEGDCEQCSTPSVHELLCRHLKRCPTCRECQCVVLAVLTIEYPPIGPYQDRPAQLWDEYPQGQGPQDQDDAHQESAGELRALHQGKSEPPPPKVDLDCCTHRRLVYRNPLLYDLIHCHHGDLPRIVDFGWRKKVHPHRTIDWGTFVELVKDRHVWVAFDQPMNDSTLNRHTFLLEVLIDDQATGHKRMRRIPCDGISYEERHGCHYAVFCPDDAWVRDELDYPRHSELDDGLDVEITLRGDGIVSRSGKALDGNFVAYRLPTGNGVQGGDFRDWFHVERRPESPGGYAQQ